jgi:glucokinase
MPVPSKNSILGVDIGGTKVAAGLFTSLGKTLAASRVPMVASGTAQEGLRAVFRAIDSVLADSKARAVRGIGISVPGWVDFHGGRVILAANLPCWREYPLASKVAGRYGMRVRIANDADAASLAEATWGAGKKSKRVFYVSLGTGIGTGMVLNRRVCLGRGGSAFEGGHMTINFTGPRCPCGKRGCIEMYSSGKAIARVARERLEESGAKGSRILALANGKASCITAEVVVTAARSNDRVARSVLSEASDHLAIWLGNIIDLLDPEIIIFGGGLGQSMLQFLPRVRKHLEMWAINPRRRKIPIVAARYGSESALVGSAALCLQDT